MRFKKCKFENGGKGFWILPFVGFDWVTGKVNFWFGWLYWMVQLFFSLEVKVAHIIDNKLNKLEGKEKHNCDKECKYWSFPHLDTACVLSGVFSVKKGCGCYNYVKK